MGDFPSVFNGQVGETTVGVEEMRRLQRPGRTGPEAAVARPAPRRHRLVVRIHLTRRHNLAQKEKGAAPRQDQAVVFAYPPEARAPRPVAFQHRGGVHKQPRLFLPSAQRFPELPQLPFHHLVVIPAVGVVGDVGKGGITPLRREIVEGDGDNAPCAGHQFRRVEPERAVVRQVTHPRLVSLRQPSVQTRRLAGNRRCRGDTAGFEAQSAGLFLYLVCC